MRLRTRRTTHILSLGQRVLCRYRWFNAGVAELVDATDLNALSALGEIQDAELLKFGETFQMAIPSQAQGHEGAQGKV